MFVASHPSNEETYTQLASGQVHMTHFLIPINNTLHVVSFNDVALS
jgi:hypothetical protein